MNKAAEDDLKQTLIYRPVLLSFESHQDHRRLEAALRDHISPQHILEEIWVSEIVEAQWEIRRLQRFRAQFVDTAKLAALRSLLRSVADANDAEIDDLAHRWFTNKGVRNQVLTLLRSVGLDEFSIDTEAYRLSMADLAAIESRLSELAARRDKVLRQIEDHRAGMAVPPRPGPRQRPGLASDVVDG